MSLRPQGRATFELYFSPQKELSRQQLNVAELDQRLAVIEKLVGNATAAEQVLIGFGKRSLV